MRAPDVTVWTRRWEFLLSGWCNGSDGQLAWDWKTITLPPVGAPVFEVQADGSRNYRLPFTPLTLVARRRSNN